MDQATEPLSYSLITGMDEMVNFTHADNMDIQSSPPKFIQYFKNQYHNETQKIKTNRVRKTEMLGE